MYNARVIPCLLLSNMGLVKTVKFKDPKYVGDPINAVKIFNDKEVDELAFLDIKATVEGVRPNKRLISEIASECFMPLSYGGGIRCLEDVKEILRLGVEKVIINSYAVENHGFIREASDLYGRQSIVVSIDVKKSVWGKYEVCTHGGSKKTGRDPVQYAEQMVAMGAGEILVTSIDRDGTRKGYDTELVKRVASTVDVPVIAAGGAGEIDDMRVVIDQSGVSAVAAGSMFVFYGPHRAVLINYPTQHELRSVCKG